MERNSNQDILDEKNFNKKSNEVVWVSWDNPAMTEGMERGEPVSKCNEKLGGKDWGCGSAGEHSPSVCVKSWVQSHVCQPLAEKVRGVSSG